MVMVWEMGTHGKEWVGKVRNKSSQKQQAVSSPMYDTWGKSLQSLFANKGAEDILPRFTVHHLDNPNSPFHRALRQRTGQPVASIQPYPNPSAMPTPQGMKPEDMISLYAMGFRDSLMRVAPILGSRGIPVFENLANAPIVKEEPKPAPQPQPKPQPKPAPAPAPQPPKFEGKGLTHNEAMALLRKYGVPMVREFGSFTPMGNNYMIELAEFDWAMQTGNVKRARELFNQIWGRNPVYMTPSEQMAITQFRQKMSERFMQMEMEQLRKQLQQMQQAG